jgi:RNA polymerase sigma-70 factor (ECF subfamily)
MASLASDSEETRQLLRRARLGDPEAKEELLDRHRPYLHRLIEVRLDLKMRARVDASDVVQEAQLEAVRRLDGYLQEPPMPFRLWLRQIAYDRLLMLRRRHIQAARRSVERDVPLPDHSSLLLAQQVLVGHSTPSAQLVQRELIRRVHQALGQLPQAEREVLIMRNLEGLSNRETAEALQSDPATVSRRYGRAVIRLREILRQGVITGSEP